MDGFRIDAIDRLLKDPDLRDDPPAAAPYALPLGRSSDASSTCTPPTTPVFATPSVPCGRRRGTRC
ncbi:MAG: hypothetical protein WKF32_00955 [Thermoleophilaceae bacterium]